MRPVYMFVDEAGNFDFISKPGSGASRYFIITSITTESCDIGWELLELRRTLAREGVDLRGEFHATEDEQRVRDRVFAAIQRHDLRVDATVLDKQAAYPRLRDEPDRFYKFGLFLHLKRVVPQAIDDTDELLLVGASFGVRRKQELLHQSIKSVASYAITSNAIKTAFWPSSVDPCLQVADYCSWAIQRKWERADERSYVLIENMIRSEVQPFRRALKGAG